jgi:zinc protease
VDFVRAFRVGSKDDPPGKEGLANLTAALMAGGGAAGRSYKQILEECFEMATAVEQQTDKELTVFWGSAHKDHEERFGSIFRGALEAPLFTEEDFARLKDEQLNFLRTELRGNNDEELAKEVLYTILFEGHPYRHHPVGTVKGLEAIRLQDVRDFHAQFFAAEQARNIEAPRARTGIHATLLDKPEARSVAISFGHHIPVLRGHRDYPALLVAQAWLGQHRNGGRLFDQIREVRGLNYGDYAYLEYFPRGMHQFEPDPCLARKHQIFQVWIRPVEWEKSIFALRLALYEIEQLRQRGLSEEDFERTRLFLRKYSKLLVKTDSLRKRYAIDSEFYGTAEYSRYIEQGLGALTHEEVNRAAREYLTTETLDIVAVGPRMEEWRARLESGAPSPISYDTEVPEEVLIEDAVVARWAVNTTSVRILPVETALEE